MPGLHGSLGNLYFKRACKRKRLSSYDGSGGNEDWFWVSAGEEREFALIETAGCVRHIWITTGCSEKDYLRKCSLQIFWDHENEPSVHVPLGDFFGMGHGLTKNFVSAPLQMSPKNGNGFNCWFPMPFARTASFRIKNECASEKLMFYFYIDYEEYPVPEKDILYFHAYWNRENPTDGISDRGIDNDSYNFTMGKNTDGKGNYVILDAEGSGHYAGCNLNIHNLRDTNRFDWMGEGDDMIFIDGETLPPTLHGTGTEDYFNTAWGPGEGDEYCAPYHGIILGGGHNYSGKHTYYRYHVEDPIVFEQSIKVTIEHGHNNHRNDDYSSTAYWYQTEPHKAFVLQSVEKRIPRADGDLAFRDD